MNFDDLPTTIQPVLDWEWPQFAVYFDDLEARDLTADNVADWLKDWTRIAEVLSELGTRLQVATTQDTTDDAAEVAYKRFLDDIQPHYRSAEQNLKAKLLASGLEPVSFEIPLRDLRTAAALFREENTPLLTAEQKLQLEYNRISGAQSVTWAGDALTLPQAYARLETLEPEPREQLWRQIAERHLQDRDVLNDVWQQLLELRQQLAHNAGYDSYREYRWADLRRFDYTPADCETFHDAIANVVVPAASRVYDRLRSTLGVERLRPWHLRRDHAHPPTMPTLHAYETIDDLERIAETIFNRVDPQLGEYFGIMRRENLLDLGNRPGKGPGGYCTRFMLAQRPFIFMNAVGSATDVRTLLHEGGHAFHAFECGQLPYIQQRAPTAEFAEVASMSMELLSAPYWAKAEGGYYSAEDVVHARRQHLEGILVFWPFMAVVDAFQHWAYTHVAEAADPANCDAQWRELWNRFVPAVDWTGFDAMQATGWQRKLHIFNYPFYYVDYGLAQLGAVQVWRNAQTDQAQAVADYRQALALGSQQPLRELFATAGARFGFDAPLLRDAVELIASTLAELGVE